MDRLPPEILLDIFKIGCELEFEPYPPLVARNTRPRVHSRHLKPFMQSVSQVCSVWRQIAFSDPAFWITRMELDFDAPHDFADLEESSHREQYAPLLQPFEKSDIDFVLGRFISTQYARWLNANL